MKRRARLASKVFQVDVMPAHPWAGVFSMGLDPDIAFVASLLGDPSRAAMCVALLDGRALPAGELARQARISAQTASNHLAKLAAGGMIQVEEQGRWRYYRLASSHVAHAIEALAVVAPRRPAPSRQEQNEAWLALREARTCYRHLAGRFGVALADCLLRSRWLKVEDRNFAITPRGDASLRALGIDLRELRPRRGVLAWRCIDWSERRPHLAGPVGAALADLALARDWVRRQPGTRALLVTPLGRAEVRRLFGLRTA